jgi:hypothetical protein
VNGKATVHGTLTCNADVSVRITGELTQVKKKAINRGAYATTATATDPHYDTSVTAASAKRVTLVRF